MRITAICRLVNGSAAVEIIGINTFCSVKRYEVQTVDGSKLFFDYSHGGWCPSASAKVLGGNLSDVRVDGVPASQWLNQEERRKRMATLRQLIEDGNVMFPVQEKLDEMVMA